MRRYPAALALVVWTFVVWTTRLRNIWTDAGLDTGDKLGRTALAASFTVLAGAVVVALWRRAPRASVVSVGVLAAWTTLVWVVRDVRIVLADHDLGFTLMHIALGVVSIALAAAAWWEGPARRYASAARDAQNVRATSRHLGPWQRFGGPRDDARRRDVPRVPRR